MSIFESSRKMKPDEKMCFDMGYQKGRGDALTWISVKDGLPKAGEEVRVYCKTSDGFPYQCQASYIPRKTLVSDGGWDGECSEYDEENDVYYVLEGWYERIHNWGDYSHVGIMDTITHWMPLPEPPKEDV